MYFDQCEAFECTLVSGGHLSVLGSEGSICVYLD